MEKKEEKEIRKWLDSFNETFSKTRDLSEEERKELLFNSANKSLLKISLLIPNYRW